MRAVCLCSRQWNIYKILHKHRFLIIEVVDIWHVQKQNLLLLAVSGCELLFWVFHEFHRHVRELLTSLPQCQIFTLYFLDKRIPIWNTCKGRCLLILSSLTVTLLCSFTGSDLSRLYQSRLPPITWCIWRGECEGCSGDCSDVMGGRATVQCFRSWVRSVDERQRVRNREKRGERTGKMVCGCQATIDNQIPRHHACGALPSL